MDHQLWGDQRAGRDFPLDRTFGTLEASVVASRELVGRASIMLQPDAERISLDLLEGDALAFGRGEQCALRFGHAPQRDGAVPRLAGWLIVASGRVCVEAPELDSATVSGGQVFPVLRLEVRGGTPRNIEPGTAFSPRSALFDVVVRGDVEWRVNVAIRGRPRAGVGTGDGSVTARSAVRLTGRQLEILRAYAAPILAGQLEPATHNQVRDSTSISVATLRRELGSILDIFYTAHLRVRDAGDSRLSVVHTAFEHGLLGDLSRSRSGAVP